MPSLSPQELLLHKQESAWPASWPVPQQGDRIRIAGLLLVVRQVLRSIEFSSATAGGRHSARQNVLIMCEEISK